MLLDFVRRLIAIYNEEPTLHRRRFFHGKSLHGEQPQEIAWLDPTGNEMSAEAWKAPHVRCLGVHFVGGHIDIDEYGTPIIGDHLLILFNADHEQEIPFALPTLEDAGPWERLFDTALERVDVETPKAEGESVAAAAAYKLAACSMVVFRAAIPKDNETNNQRVNSETAHTCGTPGFIFKPNRNNRASFSCPAAVSSKNTIADGWNCSALAVIIEVTGPSTIAATADALFAPTPSSTSDRASRIVPTPIVIA